MTQRQLNEIRARCDAATAGPWDSGRYMCDWGFPFVCYIKTPQHDPELYGEGIELRYGGTVECFSKLYNDDKNRQCSSDAAFIAHARADIPALLAEVERLRGLVWEAYEEGAKFGHVGTSGTMQAIPFSRSSVSARLETPHD